MSYELAKTIGSVVLLAVHVLVDLVCATAIAYVLHPGAEAMELHQLIALIYIALEVTYCSLASVGVSIGTGNRQSTDGPAGKK